MHPLCDRRLCDEWPRCREAVLRLAAELPSNSDLLDILSAKDTDDEGNIACCK